MTIGVLLKTVMDYIGRSVGLPRETDSAQLPEEIDPFDFYLFDDIQLPETAAAHIEKARVDASAESKTI